MERGRRAIEERKAQFDGKKMDDLGAPARKSAEPAPADREKAAQDRVAKVEEKTRAAAEPPAPATAAPAEKPKPAAALPPKPDAPAAPAPTARPNDAPAPGADKAAPAKREAEAFAGKPDEAKMKQPSAEAAPTHLTLASTQMSKSRPQVEDALRRMGALPSPPPAAMLKGAARSAPREEQTYTLELTDSQIARLRLELEKPGTSILVTGKPEDPVLAQFRRGGVFEPRNGVASGGAGVKKSPDPKAPAPESKVAEGKDKDLKEADEARPAAKAFAAENADKALEPRRRVVLHFLEVASMPTQPAGDALKK
jgi:hypothetical protein